MSDKWKDALKALGVAASIAATLTIVGLYCSGCAYKGGKVVDGTNLAIGIHVPGTEWTLSIVDYVGGVRVAGNDATIITVENEVAETNDYLGIVHIRRHTKMSATVEPVEVTAPTNSVNEL